MDRCFIFHLAAGDTIHFRDKICLLELFHFNSMVIKHVLLQGLHTSENHTANSAWVFPLSPDMSFISVADKQFLGNAAVAANITNVLWLPYMNHVHMML